MGHQKTASILYRAISGLPVEDQQEVCRRAVRSLGLKISAEYNADEDESALAEWRRGLKSSKDVAVVASLSCIPDWRAKKAKPGPVLSEVLLDFATRTPEPMMLIDVLAETSSSETEWHAHARKVLDALALGARKRPRKKYQSMSRLSRAPGVRRLPAEAQFAALPQRAQDNIARVWRDPKLRPAQKAVDAMPEDVRRDVITSVSVAYRVLGERRPGDIRAGGRGRKVARKKRKS